MATDTTTHVSPAEYLAAERDPTNDVRHEWIDGETREMTGASQPHGVLTATLTGLLFLALRGTRWVVIPNDLKVRVPDGPYYYPDVVVTPDPPRFEDDRRDIVLDPVVLFEVLSPSTESFDRGEKLDAYRRIPTLTDYVLVDQEVRRISRYARTGDHWELVVVRDDTAVVRLPSIGCELSLADVYERVPGDA